MSRSFGTPDPSCFQPDDGAMQRANTEQYLPDMLTQLHKHSDGCTDCTVGTKDQPHLRCHPEAVRVSPAPSGRCSLSPICPIAWPLSRQVCRHLQQVVWEMSSSHCREEPGQDRLSGCSGCSLGRELEVAFWVEELFCSEEGHIWVPQHVGAREQNGLGKSKDQVMLQKV